MTQRAVRRGGTVAGVWLAPLLYAGLLSVLFVVPWLFVPKPHDPVFYGFVAQVIPVLLLADAIELRFFRVRQGPLHRPPEASPQRILGKVLWDDELEQASAKAARTWIPLAFLTYGLAGEGAALYAVAYRANSSVTFALCVGALLSLGMLFFVGASGLSRRDSTVKEDPEV